MSRRGAVFALCALLLAVCARAADHSAADQPAAEEAMFDRRERAEIKRAVRDLCRREIVLLGEDASHGGGRTLEVKTEILKQLTARCGFAAVLFESQFYDLLDHARAIEAGTTSERALADAIGPLWSRARQARPLFAFLHRESLAGRLRVGGIDPQVGGVTGRYARDALGAALASALDPARRAACRDVFDRHNGWRYDEAQPFDDAAQQRLRACSDAVRQAVAARGDPPSSEIAAMAAAYARYLDMAQTGDGGMRDLGMFELLQWHRARWPRGTKLVVWCATVHAAKRLDGIAPPMRPLGAHVHAAFGDRAAVVGFTALAGAFGNPGAAGSPNPLPPADAASLEARTLADGVGLRYLDRRALKRLGTIAARPINYRKVHAAPWVEVLDALIVLREEQPAIPVQSR
jgi:erythromycin esterase-like protein